MQDELNETTWSGPLPTFEQSLLLSQRALRRWARVAAITAALLIVALGLGRSAPSTLETRNQTIGMIVGQWSFNIVQWEIEALSTKARALIDPPVAGLSADEEVVLVTTYLADTRRIVRLEGEIEHLLSVEGEQTPAQIESLRADLAELRALQLKRRPAVEAIIQRQVADELARAGLGVGGRPFPPVFFTFVEPPKKLVVSPRDRIRTAYARMLSEDIDPVQAALAEDAIRASTDQSAYITNIGGLGAYPTMVVDRSTLLWILSTVAHEWVHNYLTLFPLGLRYNVSTELITMNETVADIVGDAIGERVVRRFYPEFAPPDPVPIPPSAEGGEVIVEEYIDPRAQPFDYQREMRQTRLNVDRLLAAGLVETAERYMEARRQFFVAHGYNMRVLNQAYFAFHGSYGTSSASSSPIGPKMQSLHAEIDDLATFLRTVRWFTNPRDLDRALFQWTTLE